MLSDFSVSRNKSRKLIENISSTEVLFKGLRRRISQNQYSKIHPKIKLDGKSKIRNLTIFRNGVTQQKLYEENFRIREENKIILEQNRELKVRIKKMNKLAEIYDKKMENHQLQDLQFQKIVELKLLLEVEELEETAEQKDIEYEQIVKQLRRKRDMGFQYTIEPHIQLHGILAQAYADIQNLKNSRQMTIKKKYQSLRGVNEKIVKLRSAGRQKRQQLQSVNGQLQKQQSIKPQAQNFIQDSNDSGIYGNHARTKLIEQLQRQIERIQGEYNLYGEMVQQQMDKRVRQKILLYKGLQQLKQLLRNAQRRQQQKYSKVLW